LRIIIKTFGPEITGLIGRERVIDLNPSSTLDDLIRRLEEDIKTKYGWTQRIMDSNFMILINGRHAETLHDRILEDGDSVIILSPIGGG